MTTLPTLQSYLSSQLNIKNSSFWDGLKDILDCETCLNEKISQKSKLVLIEAIRTSATCDEWKKYIPIIVSMLNKMSDMNYLDQNFSEKDQNFFSSLASFTYVIYGKPSNDDFYEIKNEVLSLFDKMFKNSQIINEKTINGIVRSIITMFKDCDEDQTLYAKALAIIYHLIIKNSSLTSLIQECAQILFDAAKEIQSPKTQMQLFNILWIAQARVKEASFSHKEDALFISCVHKISSKINNGIKSFIISLQFQNASFPNDTVITSGWIDIGIIDLIFCFDEKIMTIPFDAICGLDAENTIMTIVLEQSFKDFGESEDHKITIKLSRKPSSKMIAEIFSRISRGESQPIISDHDDENANLPIQSNSITQQTPTKPFPIKDTTNQTPHSAERKPSPAKNHNSIVHISVPNQLPPNISNGSIVKNVKSSVAMYIARDAQMPSYSSQIDENLFTDFKSSTNSIDPQKVSEMPVAELNTDDYAEQDSIIVESPPPPSIDMNMSMNISISNVDTSENGGVEEEDTEEEADANSHKSRNGKHTKKKVVIIEEASKPRKPQFDISQDDILLKHTSIVSERICAGIDALTKQRMDCVDHFGEQIQHHVDSFKDDIKTAEKDKEHCSVKQLELSKQKFQANIQQFKKKEAAIQQTLSSIEEETKQFSSKITEIQRKMRSEIQKRRLDLEKQLKNLRKMIRKNDRSLDQEDDESSDLNEDYEDFVPKSRTKFQITA